MAWVRTARGFQLALAIATILAAVHLAWLLLEIGGPDATVVFDDLILVFVPIASAFACFAAGSAEHGRLRTGWPLMGAAVLSWGLGQAAWSFYEIWLGQEVPFPSVADIGYLAFIPLAVASTLFLSQDVPDLGARLRSLLDGGIAAAALLFVSWAYVIGPVYEASTGTLLERLIGLAYPVGDVLVITAILALAIRPVGLPRTTLLLLALGLVGLAVADSAFAYLTTTETYATGNLIDVGWLVGFLLLGLASLRPAPALAKSAASESTRRPLVSMLPYAPVVIAVPIAVQQQIEEGALEPTLFWIALATVLLIVVRQAMALIDNRGLNRVLEAANAELKEAQASRTRVLNTVTHDLANALSPIKLEIKVLSSPAVDLTPKGQRSVEVTRRNIEHIENLTRDLQDLAKLEAGQLAIERASTDLNAIIQDVAAILEKTSKAAGLRLETRLGKIPTLEADSKRLTQAVFNLVGNGIRFTRPGGDVLVESQVEAGELVVQVRDTGRGLAPEDIGRLFLPFSQVHQRSEVKERGSGLGLFICKGIVEAHGGRIWAESPGLGKGSTFSFAIPLGKG